MPRPGCHSPIGLAASDRRTDFGLRHVPLVFPGSGKVLMQGSRQNGSLAWEAVWHSLLSLPVLPVTGFGDAVPPVSGFGRFRHLRVSENAHKPLTF